MCPTWCKAQHPVKVFGINPSITMAIENPFHNEILDLIRSRSGAPTSHTFLDGYLGNDHPRYPISAPELRKITRDWMKSHKTLSCEQFATLLTSLIKGESATEKWMAGMLLNYASKEQQGFDPVLFDTWLDHLVGWAEVDAVCTGEHTIKMLPANWTAWKQLLTKFSKSKNINKRRASLVLLCSPMRHVNDERLASIALANIERLKVEKEGLITKAISWTLRSMTTHYRKALTAYLNEQKDSLPKIAVRETMTKLRTGKKT